ncbi:MAG: sulfur carrier protein ThiS [Candidatus Omnitrophota bacterium]|nr:sulfur carrier protein ThiS [Candidatus Omnitrophota bacterium]
MADITINGKKEVLDKNISIAELLKRKNIRPEVVTIELNDNIIERKDYGSVAIKEGDRLEFVYFMGGGSIRRNFYFKR